MAKNYSSSYIFELVLKLFFVIIVVGPTCNAQTVPQTVPIVNGTSVTESFLFANELVWMDNCVYISDMIEKKLYRYDPSTKKTNSVLTEKAFKFLVPVKSPHGHTFLGGDGQSIYSFLWDGSSIEIEIQKSLQVLNDTNEAFVCGKIDPQGRLFIGSSLTADHGKLYTVDKIGNINLAIDNIGIPIDIAWSPDNIRLYVADGTSNTIVCHKYGIDRGVLDGTCKEFFNFTAKGITCQINAMTIDTAGHLWVACYGNSYVLQIDIVMDKLMMQVDILEGVSPSNVVFGGETMEDLYITTLKNQVKGESGSLFVVAKTGYKGRNVQPVEVDWRA